MIIYKYTRKCYACRNEFEVYTYLQYKRFYDDVTFPYQNWMMYEVYAELHQDNPYFDMNSNALNFPVKTLGYDSELDSVVIKSGHFQTVEMRSSRQVKVPYAANICPHCGAFQGRYHILEEVTDRFLKPNTPMDIECEL